MAVGDFGGVGQAGFFARDALELGGDGAAAAIGKDAKALVVDLAGGLAPNQAILGIGGGEEVPGGRHGGKVTTSFGNSPSQWGGAGGPCGEHPVDLAGRA